MRALERYERRESVTTDPAPRFITVQGGVETDQMRTMKPNAWNGKAIAVYCSGGDSQGTLSGRGAKIAFRCVVIFFV